MELNEWHEQSRNPVADMGVVYRIEKKERFKQKVKQQAEIWGEST